MAEKDNSVLYRSLLNMIKSVSRIQQERQKIMMGVLESDMQTGGSLMGKMMESQIEKQQKKELAPFELEQKRQEKLLPSAPSMTYKDTIFQEIRKKPQDQWEQWEQQFMDTYTGGGEQAIVDAQGNIIGYRPRKSVFQPKGGRDLESELNNIFSREGAEPTTSPEEITEEDITEENIAYTMRKHGLTRDEVLRRIKK